MSKNLKIQTMSDDLGELKGGLQKPAQQVEEEKEKPKKDKEDKEKATAKKKKIKLEDLEDKLDEILEDTSII